MPKTIITPTAKFRPGKCAISGDTQGPFFDTGILIPRFGRLYLSIPHLKLRLNEHGLLDTEEVASLKAVLESRDITIKELEETEADYKELLRLISKYLPDQEPEVIEKRVDVARKPTDVEVEDWIRRHGAKHPAVLKAKTVEKGRSEEWDMLYRPKPGVSNPEPVEEPEAPKEPEPVSTASDNKMCEHLGQEIDLDEVLKLNISEIVEDYAVGKGEEFEAALVAREWYRAEVEGRKVRKGLLSAFGYWDEETNEGLVPDFEETING